MAPLRRCCSSPALLNRRINPEADRAHPGSRASSSQWASPRRSVQPVWRGDVFCVHAISIMTRTARQAETESKRKGQQVVKHHFFLACEKSEAQPHRRRHAAASGAAEGRGAIAPPRQSAICLGIVQETKRPAGRMSGKSRRRPLPTLFRRTLRPNFSLRPNFFMKVRRGNSPGQANRLALPAYPRSRQVSGTAASNASFDRVGAVA
jgi:hypothetical protein